MRGRRSGGAERSEAKTGTRPPRRKLRSNRLQVRWKGETVRCPPFAVRRTVSNLPGYGD